MPQKKFLRQGFIKERLSGESEGRKGQEGRKVTTCVISGRVPGQWFQPGSVGHRWDVEDASKFVGPEDKRARYMPPYGVYGSAWGRRCCVRGTNHLHLWANGHKAGLRESQEG